MDLRQRFNREQSNGKYTEFMAKCSRRICLLAMFEASLFTAFGSRFQFGANNGARTRLAEISGEPVASKQIFAGTLARLANSSKLKRAFANYSLFMIALYAYWASVSIVTALLDLKPFAAYRHIDCFWLGRFTLNGRVSLGTKYICLQVAITVLIVRFRNTFGGLDVYLQAIDFLSRDLADIAHCVRRQDLTRVKMLTLAGDNSKLSPTDDDNDDDDDDDDDTGNGYDIYYTRCKPPPTARMLLHERKLSELLTSGQNIDRKLQQQQQRHRRDLVEFNEVFFARIELFQAGGEFIILKLNRSRQNWICLNSVVPTVFVGMIALLIVWLAFSLTIMTPTIVTQRGFELIYTNCVNYIRECAESGGNKSQANEFAFIYEVHQADSHLKLANESAVILPLDDFVGGYYHIIRIALDYFNSVLFFFDSMAFVLSFFSLQVPIYYDIIINAREIRKRLVRLRAIKWQQQAIESICYTGQQLAGRHLPNDEHIFINHPGDSRTFKLTRLAANRLNYDVNVQSLYCRSTTIETLLLQALLLDHFKTLKSYNDYLSLCSAMGTFVWCGFTLTLLLWIGSTGGNEVYYEFYVAIVFASLAFMVFLAINSIITRINRKFYPLITSLMALDDTSSNTKQRWMTIVNYYSPKAIYCPTIMSKQITSLLVIKIFAWTFSALCVVVGFFKMRTDTKNRHASRTIH